MKCIKCGIYVRGTLCSNCTKEVDLIGKTHHMYLDDSRPDAADCNFFEFNMNLLEDDISELKSIDGSETGRRYYANEGSWKEDAGAPWRLCGLRNELKKKDEKE